MAKRKFSGVTTEIETLEVTGNTTLGDASGDSVTVNAGTFTAPNATGTGSTAVANVGALNGLFGATRTAAQFAAGLYTGWNLVGVMAGADHLSVFGTTGTGSGSQGDGKYSVSTGTTSGSTASAGWYYFRPYKQGGAANYAKPMVVAVRIDWFVSSTNGERWFTYGSPRDGKRGFGVKAENNTLYLVAHDGTTLTKSATGVAISNYYMSQVIFYSDGAGNVGGYLIDNTKKTIPSITGGPTTSSVHETEERPDQYAANNADSADTSFDVYSVLCYLKN